MGLYVSGEAKFREIRVKENAVVRYVAKLARDTLKVIMHLFRFSYRLMNGLFEDLLTYACSVDKSLLSLPNI